METKYWAKRGKKKIVGPFPTREEALEKFEEAYPHKGPDYMRFRASRLILSGYGEFGPHFDMRWTPLKGKLNV